MASTRTRQNRHRLAALMGAALVALTASGCVPAANDGTATASGNEAAASAYDVPVSWTDEDTCSAFGDVLTIMNNAAAAVAEGRMSDQEELGWLRLATRVQDHISSAADGAVADALIAVKKAAPAIPEGSSDISGIGSDSWMSAGTDLREACIGAGYEVTSEGFVGG